MHKTAISKRTYQIPEQREPEVLANFDHTRPVALQFKKNVQEAVCHTGISFRTFFKALQQNGVKMTREAWYCERLHKFPNLLYIGTFSRILGIETHYLLRSDFKQLLESGEVKPSILGIHRSE